MTGCMHSWRIASCGFYGSDGSANILFNDERKLLADDRVLRPFQSSAVTMLYHCIVASHPSST